MHTSEAFAATNYRFQRLREQIRDAIISGELAGKLPGERNLGKRFGANAKTVSKALTDLTAEGVLDRSVGRGTFVKGSAPFASNDRRWLVICDPQQVDCETVQAIQKICGDIEISTDLSRARPSFISRFNAVIDLSSKSQDEIIRDLIVRRIPVVAVSPKTQRYSTRAVQFDYSRAVSMAGRDLMLLGHVRFAAVEPNSFAIVARALHATAMQYELERV